MNASTTKTLTIALILASDSSIDRAATLAAFAGDLDTLIAARNTDFDSVAVELTEYLLDNPAMRNNAMSNLVRALHERRIENGVYGDTKAPEYQANKNAGIERLEVVLPEYIKSNTDQFHIGRGNGVLIRFVLGEVMKDKDGNVLYSASTADNEGGDEVQAYRISDEDWTKACAKVYAKPGRKSAAELAATSAK